MDHLKIAIILSEVISCVILLMIVVIAVIKIKRAISAKTKQYYLCKYEDYFKYIQCNLQSPTPLLKPSFKVNKAGMRVLEEKIITLINMIDGEARNKLITLSRECGIIDYEVKRLSSINNWIIVNAAFNLGALHAEEAVPKLLKLLNKKRHKTMYFVLANAVASCSRNKYAVIEMVKKVVSLFKDSHQLMVEIIKTNCLVDSKEIFIKMLQSDNKDMIKIALIGLSEGEDRRITERLSELVEENEKEIRIKAIKSLINNTSSLQHKHIEEFSKHTDWEVRAAIAKTIGIYKFKQYSHILKDGLSNESWWVRYNSAESLLKLGEEGFEILCQAVIEDDDKYKVDMAQYMIDKEIQEYNALQKSEEAIMEYNNKLFLFQKFFNQELKYVEE